MAGSRGRKVDPSRFAMVPRPDVPRSAFDGVFTHKTTFDAGALVPVYVDEVLPGDSHRVRMTAFARLATPVVPIMDNLIMESFFFFVPARLVWDNWQRFMGEQDSPDDSTVFLVPQVEIFRGTGVDSAGLLSDLFGITLNTANPGASINVSALPFRAYNLVWNEWFRDEDLLDRAGVPKGDGPDVQTTYELRFRGKRHDYFTSARPWPQKPMNIQDSGLLGGPIMPGGRMTFPQLGAPVTGIGIAANVAVSGGTQILRYPGARVEPTSEGSWINGSDLGVDVTGVGGFEVPAIRVLINDIRLAVTVQQLLERSARGGTRYSELVRAHFGVVSPDARLQRPEYLGGGRSYVQISAVAQQSATGVEGSSTALGELAGIGTVATQGHSFSGSFTEHGFILGMVNVRADLTYQNGINRMWFRRTQFDYYWPSLANLGEQPILSKEIWAEGLPADDTVFGYQERWAEYRNMPNRISGRFRSTAQQPLDVWHLAQNFETRPVLSGAFITEDPPMERIIAIDQPRAQFLFDGYFEVRRVRPLPMFSVPGVGPRF